MPEEVPVPGHHGSNHIDIERARRDLHAAYRSEYRCAHLVIDDEGLG